MSLLFLKANYFLWQSHDYSFSGNNNFISCTALFVLFDCLEFKGLIKPVCYCEITVTGGQRLICDWAGKWYSGPFRDEKLEVIDTIFESNTKFIMMSRTDHQSTIICLRIYGLWWAT